MTCITRLVRKHKEFCAEKTQDDDYYVPTLSAIARELEGKGMNSAKVHIAAGLPLTWVATQKEDFQKYLLQNERVDFMFRNKQYHVEFEGADIYPQGFAAAFTACRISRESICWLILEMEL